MCSHFVNDLPEYCRFQLRKTFLCPQQLGLELLELVRDVALSIDKCLLANIVSRHEVGIGATHLDVVAEHLVEPYLQRLDAGAFTLARLKLEQPLLPLSARPPQLVHVSAVARPHDIAIAYRDRRVIGYGSPYLGDHVRVPINRRRHVGQERAPDLGLHEPVTKERAPLQRLGQ
ncbi:MAG: hypothetical protein BWY85_01250 [Firmicutes bacterium ADurb.Bin506]|nr:MAG: hypothetical protein BWY85_01250 [Firmicutes bacterium ADurb.Bin506]